MNLSLNFFLVVPAIFENYEKKICLDFFVDTYENVKKV